MAIYTVEMYCNDGDGIIIGDTSGLPGKIGSCFIHLKSAYEACYQAFRRYTIDACFQDEEYEVEHVCVLRDGIPVFTITNHE